MHTIHLIESVMSDTMQFFKILYNSALPLTDFPTDFPTDQSNHQIIRQRDASLKYEYHHGGKCFSRLNIELFMAISIKTYSYFICMNLIKNWTNELIYNLAFQSKCFKQDISAFMVHSSACILIMDIRQIWPQVDQQSQQNICLCFLW